MDICSGTSCSALSNFSPHIFKVDGVTCYSMEGFLQSLKFKSMDMQVEVCKLIGKKAKFKGKRKTWWKTQTLWWQGVEIDRHSREYQILLDKAFDSLVYHSRSFRKALLATGNAVLTHSVGKKDPYRTVLTEKEFVSRLMRIREEIKHGEYWHKIGKKIKFKFERRNNETLESI